MLTLNTNISSLQTQQALANSQTALQTSLQRLATGLRVNNARDDAAAYAVGSSLTTTINSQTQGIQNANGATSYLQTADSYLNQVESNLQRMRQLAVEANNDALSAADKTNLDKEYQQLATANKNIATNANFNQNKLFDGSLASVSFQYGEHATASPANPGDDVATVNNVNLSTFGTVTAPGDVKTSPNAVTAQLAIDADLVTLKGARAELGAQLAGLSSIVNVLMSSNTALYASRSAMIDTDYAAETSNMTRQNILQQAGTAMLAQANSAPNSILNLLKG